MGSMGYFQEWYGVYISHSGLYMGYMWYMGYMGYNIIYRYPIYIPYLYGFKLNIDWPSTSTQIAPIPAEESEGCGPCLPGLACHSTGAPWGLGVGQQGLTWTRTWTKQAGLRLVVRDFKGFLMGFNQKHPETMIYFLDCFMVLSCSFFLGGMWIDFGRAWWSI